MQVNQTPPYFVDREGYIWTLFAPASKKQWRRFQPGEDPATSTKFHAFTNEEADKAYAKSGLVNSTTSADEGERPPLFDLPDEEAAEQPDFTDEQPQQPKQPHQDGGVDYAALLRQCAVSPTEDIGEPPVCVSVKTDTGTSVLGTLGNISVCIGKAKSRKTTAVGAVIAAALSPGEPQLNRFVGHADKDRNTVLYIDTEQGRYHVQRCLKRICALLGVTDPPNLKAFGMRSVLPRERRDRIEWAIYNTPGVFFVVIDGIKDLVFDINSPEEATDMTTRLLRWSDEQQVHIMTILHQNKGDQNARGHLGTELVHKAETIFSVTKDSENKGVSTVAAEYCRDMDFEPFSFSVDADNLPYFVDASERTTPGKGKPTMLTAEEIDQVFIRAFGQDKSLQRAVLQTNVQEASDYMGKRLANNRAVELIARVTADGYLLKEQPAKGYPVYRINPDKIRP